MTKPASYKRILLIGGPGDKDVSHPPTLTWCSCDAFSLARLKGIQDYDAIIYWPNQNLFKIPLPPKLKMGEVEKHIKTIAPSVSHDSDTYKPDTIFSTLLETIQAYLQKDTLDKHKRSRATPYHKRVFFKELPDIEKALCGDSLGKLATLNCLIAGDTIVVVVVPADFSTDEYSPCAWWLSNAFRWMPLLSIERDESEARPQPDERQKAILLAHALGSHVTKPWSFSFEHSVLTDREIDFRQEYISQTRKHCTACL